LLIWRLVMIDWVLFLAKSEIVILEDQFTLLNYLCALLCGDAFCVMRWYDCDQTLLTMVMFDQFLRLLVIPLGKVEFIINTRIENKRIGPSYFRINTLRWNIVLDSLLLLFSSCSFI
jgi:hypothetical protein